MAKNNHIYTLNHNLKSLEQQDEDDDFRVKASSDHRVDEDRKPETYHMINNVDDIFRIVKETKEENPDLEEGHTIHLVVSADDLKGMFFNLKKVGYEPGVNFDCRRLSALYLKFNGLNITIKSQQLVSTILDGDIALEDEAIYNKTTEAMTLFHTAFSGPI